MRRFLSHIVMLVHGIGMLGPFALKVIATALVVGFALGALIL